MVWKARDVMALKKEFVSFAGREGANLSVCRVPHGTNWIAASIRSSQ